MAADDKGPRKRVAVERAASDPLGFLPRGNALLRRVMLAEVLGPPRSQVPWRSPSERPQEGHESPPVMIPQGMMPPVKGEA